MSTQPATLSNDTFATITLRFRVDDKELLAQLASEAIDAHGMGHKFDPEDYADQIVELLLHSNPAIPAYLDLGIELYETKTENTKGRRK